MAVLKCLYIYIYIYIETFDIIEGNKLDFLLFKYFSKQTILELYFNSVRIHSSKH